MRSPNPQHNSKPKPFSRAWHAEQSRKFREEYANTYDFTSRRPVFDGGAVFVPDANIEALGFSGDRLCRWKGWQMEPMSLRDAAQWLSDFNGYWERELFDTYDYDIGALSKLMGQFAEALPEHLQNLEPMIALTLPKKANYHFRAVICGHCFTGEARLPDCRDRFHFGMRAVFRAFMGTENGKPYSIERIESNNRIAWRRL